MSDNIKLHYSSGANITFNGVIETNVSREEWAEMSGAEKDEFITEEMCNLVDVWVEED